MSSQTFESNNRRKEKKWRTLHSNLQRKENMRQQTNKLRPKNPGEESKGSTAGRKHDAVRSGSQNLRTPIRAEGSKSSKVHDEVSKTKRQEGHKSENRERGAPRRRLRGYNQRGRRGPNLSAKFTERDRACVFGRVESVSALQLQSIESKLLEMQYSSETKI